jgi:DNA/RNA endonuclease YhcR with UshA esterase domain
MVRVVGVVSDFHGTWQISGLVYNPMKPNDPANTAVLSRGNEISFNEITIDQFNSNVTINVNDEEKTYKFTQLAVSTCVSMKNLKVVDTYTTNNGGNSDGAMTLTCQVDGQFVDVRTIVLKDENGNRVTASAYQGKTIDVKGIVDYFNGAYQIKVFSTEDIKVH